MSSVSSLAGSLRTSWGSALLVRGSAAGGSIEDSLVGSSFVADESSFFFGPPPPFLDFSFCFFSCSNYKGNQHKLSNTLAN